MRFEIFHEHFYMAKLQIDLMRLLLPIGIYFIALVQARNGKVNHSGNPST